VRGKGRFARKGGEFLTRKGVVVALVWGEADVGD
jgi:hypothetical protein